MITLDADLEVSTEALRDAFSSTLPHAARNKRGEDVAPLHRIRLIVDRGRLYVCAANGTTLALAKVPIRSGEVTAPDPDDAPLIVDLTPKQVRDVLYTFKLERPSQDRPEQTINLVIDDDGVELIEAGTLMPGTRLLLPTTDPSTQFPDVPALIHRGLTEIGTSPIGKPLVTMGGTLALFKKASDAYGEPARIEPIGVPESPGFAVTVGPAFAALVPTTRSDYHDKAASSALVNWLRELPPPAERVEFAVEPDDDEVSADGREPAGDELPLPAEPAADDEP